MPENIDRCLNCTVPPELCCGQCEDTVFGYAGRGRPAKATLERVAQFVWDGWTDNAICRELGIAKDTLHKKKWLCRKAGLLT